MVFATARCTERQARGSAIVIDESRLNLVAELTERAPAGLYQGESLRRPDGSYLYF